MNFELSENKEFLKFLGEKELPVLVKLGICGLHVIHGSFQTGFSKSDWSIDKRLNSTREHFMTRQPDVTHRYVKINQDDTFPVANIIVLRSG